MKRFFSLFLAFILLLPMGAYAESATAALQEMYAQAELAMVQGDYAGAAAKFEALGAYSDASQMTMYCKAIAAAEMLGLYSMAVDAFHDLGDFKDSKQMATYYQGRSDEAAGAIDVAKASDNELHSALLCCQDAEEIYAGLAFFKDSLSRMSACSKKIIEIEAEQSRRTEADYQAALALEQNGDYAGAIDIYETIKEYKDSASRINICQNAIKEHIYQEAFALEQNGDYAGAIEIYQTIREYKDSAERIGICQNELASQETELIYQEAMALLAEGQYSGAYKLFVSLGEYRDSASRAEECYPYMPYTAARYTLHNAKGEAGHSYTIALDYDSAGNLIFKKNNNKTNPTETTYVYENGKLISSLEKGVAMYSGSVVEATYTKQRTYNEQGDPVIEHYQATSVSLQRVTIDRIDNYTYTYEYENGRVKKSSRFYDGKLYSDTTYEYDAFGRVLREVCTSRQGVAEGYFEVIEYYIE